MPHPPKQKVEVTCPKCGQSQQEPPTAYSTFCKHCGAHFLLQETLRPQPAPRKPEIERRHVKCFQCGTELEVPTAAASTMCKRCSAYVDLADYHITHTVSKNFRTHGRLVLEEKGFLLNTEAFAGEAVIKGRVIGKLVVERTLEIHSGAKIKGTFTAGCFVVPVGHHFHWPEPLTMRGVEVCGELVATIHATGIVRLRSTARFFGDVQAGGLVVEAGAVFVGHATVGT